ncbi:Chromosome partitioning protein ParB [Sphingomonas antarctica]|uniref:ParB/RepB/Spo0J family partition protein n=1 Tax=Sphingomonas antarctica TaxID=2040274 RepID=UPI0039EC87F7
MPDEKRRPMGLGRGLSALLGEAQPAGGTPEGQLREIPVAWIHRNPDQPRRHFDDAALEELAESIRRHGLLQPITVSPMGGDAYAIVAGERRWRAAQRARLDTIPVMVRDVERAEGMELALIENIQREQLNAFEEGDAYNYLMSQHGLTQEQVAEAVKKSRSHVANLGRVADQTEGPVRELVIAGKLSMGHARALLGRPDAADLANEAIAKGWSVRQIEKIVKDGRNGGKPTSRTAPVDADVAQLERQLSDVLGLNVSIDSGADGGAVTVRYATLDQLDMICQRLSGERI